MIELHKHELEERSGMEQRGAGEQDSICVKLFLDWNHQFNQKNVKDSLQNADFFQSGQTEVTEVWGNEEDKSFTADLVQRHSSPHQPRPWT